MFASTLPTVALIFFAPPSPSTVESASSVLMRMDNSAAKFQGMTANVEHVTYTAVINDSTTESGTVKLRKVGPGEVQGLLAFTNPDQKIILFAKRKAQVYTPASNSVQVWDLGKYSGQLDQFLMLGFGTPKAEIEKGYAVSVRDRPIIDGQPTTRLELIPRSPDMLKRMSRMELWILDDGSYPIREIVHEPSNDSLKVVYTNVRINPTPPLKDSDLKLNLPKSVQFTYPQK